MCSLPACRLLSDESSDCYSSDSLRRWAVGLAALGTRLRLATWVLCLVGCWSLPSHTVPELMALYTTGKFALWTHLGRSLLLGHWWAIVCWLAGLESPAFILILNEVDLQHLSSPQQVMCSICVLPRAGLICWRRCQVVHSQLGSSRLWMSDIAHHHLAVGVVFILAGHMYQTDFGIAPLDGLCYGSKCVLHRRRRRSLLDSTASVCRWVVSRVSTCSSSGALGIA